MEGALAGYFSSTNLYILKKRWPGLWGHLLFPRWWRDSCFLFLFSPLPRVILQPGRRPPARLPTCPPALSCYRFRRFFHFQSLVCIVYVEAAIHFPHLQFLSSLVSSSTSFSSSFSSFISKAGCFLSMVEERASSLIFVVYIYSFGSNLYSLALSFLYLTLAHISSDPMLTLLVGTLYVFSLRLFLSQ